MGKLCDQRNYPAPTTEPAPAVEGCYATRLSAEGDRLRRRLAAETRFTDDP
jgi:hypothetical protein